MHVTSGLTQLKEAVTLGAQCGRCMNSKTLRAMNNLLEVNQSLGLGTFTLVYNMTEK